jgi:hypothetical protein
MVSARKSLVLALAPASLVAAQSCQLQFDGRVPADLAVLDFDVPNDIFSNAFVLGEGLVFSQALRLLPVGAGSLVSLTLVSLPQPDGH